MKDHVELWERALVDIELAVSEANFSTWFNETNILRSDEGIIYLGVPNSFIQEWLYKKFHNTILKTLRQLNEQVRGLEYVIVKDSDRKKVVEKSPQVSPTISMPLNDFYINKDDNLNPRYVFDSFIVGPFNELAHAASKSVVKTPGSTYNPLFIYGNTGHGKTHLIQAIGNHIKKDFPQKKVFYLTSERFGSEYFSSLQNNTTQKFKDRYRKYDVIIMDDIQFFANKEKFQEELFHLFETFYQTNRQLVFSSDKHPNFIPGLEDRLKSRFNQGMIIDIPAPDHESRIAIIRAKSLASNVDLKLDVLDFLAASVDSNVRELEGIVNVIVCQTQLKNRPLSLLEIKNLIKNNTKPKKNISIKDVMKLIANFYNISEESVHDKTRKKEVVKPRQVIMYILREDFNVSFPSIGEKMGGRDHTTVIHSCNKVKEDLKTDAVLMEEISQIRAMM
ncbi:MAG: chromosomal replication initiator protein DnaA [Candidatus Taylorbacteria bacterium]|nr:chromosomal replication initiator protein DnaA [Candidatus Taylorbacteria bacterium]